MTLRSLLFAASALTAMLAGCADSDDGHDMQMGADSYHMELSGMPMAPMAPGSMFNVTVRSTAEHEEMHGMMSDHIGAHFWNSTQSDPTATFAASTSCVHTTGEVPGTFTARCTAPMQGGVYHMRAHTRMMDDGEMHHYWSDEQSFTVGV